MVKTLPLLDELHLHCICITKQAIQAIGRCCTQLKTFRLNYQGKRELYFPYDKNAKAIAESMPGLCHLQLIGNRITRNGLLAIIDNCSHLESLDIRCCFGATKLGPELLRRLYQQMSHLRLPYDSTEGCGLLDIYDLDSLSNDDLSGQFYDDSVSDDYDYHNDDYAYNECSGGSDTDDYHNDDYYYNENSGGSDTYDYHNDDYDYNESGGSDAGSY